MAMGQGAGHEGRGEGEAPHTMHKLGVIARRSCRRSWNRYELQRAIPGASD
jgi:hypothetical protein